MLAAIDKLMKNSSSVIESQINGVALSSNSSIDEDKNASEASTVNLLLTVHATLFLGTLGAFASFVADILYSLFDILLDVKHRVLVFAT